ncbi:MAG: hypothetical protein CMF25_04590 [Kangiellaceae bacterium]|nr:hypothetical protein [Kangiellaceae bacterium]
MQCPKCKTHPLRPTKIEPGLSAMGCLSCEGAMISLLGYRDWVESQGEVVAEADCPNTASAVSEDNDTKTAMTCPKCSRLMTKYLISGAHNNRIDLCSFCDEAWLDHGEWALLKVLELSHQMPKVFTDAWQRKARKEVTENLKINRLQSLVGEEDTERAIELKAWLKDHPNKAALLQFMGSD